MITLLRGLLISGLKMVKVDTDVNGNPLPCSLFMDTQDVKNFGYLGVRVRSNFDNVGIVVGEEGAGKTTWAFQKALYMDYRFNIDNVVFNESQFLKATETLPHGSSIVWDESDAASEHWASNIVKAVTKRLKRVRKNNYTIFLVTPTFFDFGKYFVNHRAIFLVDIYAKFNSKTGRIDRGFFRSFNRPLMRSLYIKGKTFWNMKAEYPDYIGRFPNYPSGFPIDMSPGGEYDVKKNDAMKDIETNDVDPKQAVINYRQSIIPLIRAELEKRDISMSQQQLANALGVSKATINSDLKVINRLVVGG